MRKLIFLIPVVALALGVWAYQQASTGPDMQVVTLLPSGKPLPELSLVAADGAAAGREVFQGQWSLLFMGFTNCGHLCPMTMAEMRMIDDQVEGPLNVVFFSVDPNRDTPAKIREYVAGFDESWSGMTASPAEIDKLAATLGAPYFVDTTPDNYVVDHSSALFLIGPDASLAGVITQPLDIAATANDLNQLL